MAHGNILTIILKYMSHSVECPRCDPLRRCPQPVSPIETNVIKSAFMLLSEDADSIKYRPSRTEGHRQSPNDAHKLSCPPSYTFPTNQHLPWSTHKFPHETTVLLQKGTALELAVSVLFLRRSTVVWIRCIVQLAFSTPAPDGGNLKTNKWHQRLHSPHGTDCRGLSLPP